MFSEKSAHIAAVFCIHKRDDITKKDGSNTDTKKGLAPQKWCICEGSCSDLDAESSHDVGSAEGD